MDIKRTKDCLKKEFEKSGIEVDYLKVGWCENQDCIKIIVGLKKLDVNLKDLKDVVESVVYYYTDNYVLMIDILTYSIIDELI